jgi:glucose-1-phosphate thymidylyltransferase
MKGIILHGGHGTRLRPFTYTRPKQLLPIANIPMSQYCVDSLKNAGITNIAMVIGGDNSFKVREYYGNGEKFGVEIIYVEQDQPRGISHAISLCKNFIGNDKFVVFLGDNILLKDISESVEQFRNSNDAAKILLCEVSNPTQFGIADVEKNGKIKKIIEKPKNPPSNLAVIGIYFLTPIIFEIIPRLKPSWRNELEITDALQMLLEEGKIISYDTITNYWKDTGTISDILDANKTILENIKSYFEGKKDDTVIINGKVMVGRNSYIKGGVKIDGPVIIGENCIVDGNIHIGPNVSIGNNSKISNCTIDNSIIMDGCIIDYNGSLTNSIMSYNSQITSNNEKKSVLILGEDNKIVFNYSP